MSKINEQIERLRGFIRKCYATIAEKNGIVPEVGERTMANLPDAIASTHDTLEELTITENGIYTPQEGVDGFSKVVARVVQNDKVAITQLRISKDCLNDGVFSGANLIDTSKATVFDSWFFGQNELVSADVRDWDTSNVQKIERFLEGCSSLNDFDVSKWDVSKVTSLGLFAANCRNMRIWKIADWNVQNCQSFASMFAYNYSLQELDVSKWNVQNGRNFAAMFQDCNSLQELDVSKWNVQNGQNFRSMFGSCSKLEMLDLTQWDVQNATNLNSMFAYNQKLSSLVGGKTIDEVIAENISILKNAKISFSIGYYQWCDRASLRALINGLADLTGQTAQTLTLGTTLLAKLTNEDIAVATAKNWTIV